MLAGFGAGRISVLLAGFNVVRIQCWPDLMLLAGYQCCWPDSRLSGFSAGRVLVMLAGFDAAGRISVLLAVLNVVRIHCWPGPSVAGRIWCWPDSIQAGFDAGVLASSNAVITSGRLRYYYLRQRIRPRDYHVWPSLAGMVITVCTES